jgi:hypothetical protein
MTIKHPTHHNLLSLPKRMFLLLKAIIVQIKNLEVALPLVAESTMLAVENLLAQLMNLLLLRLLWMIPRGNSKVLAGAAEAGVAVENAVENAVKVAVEKVAVVGAPSISTVKLAKPTPTRRFIKAGVVTMAMPNLTLSKLPL